jgi:hypothetical protein
VSAQREQRILGFDRRLELHVEQRLLPRQVQARGQRRGVEMRERRVEFGEGAVARDRRAHGDDRQRHAALTLVELEVVQEPDLRGTAQLRRRIRHIEIARPECRKHDVLHRFQRRAHEHHGAVAGGPHEQAHGDVARHFVRVRSR